MLSLALTLALALVLAPSRSRALSRCTRALLRARRIRHDQVNLFLSFWQDTTRSRFPWKTFYVPGKSEANNALDRYLLLRNVKATELR